MRYLFFPPFFHSFFLITSHSSSSLHSETPAKKKPSSKQIPHGPKSGSGSFSALTKSKERDSEEAARNTHEELMRQLDGGARSGSPALPPGLDTAKNRFKSAARANRLADEGGFGGGKRSEDDGHEGNDLGTHGGSGVSFGLLGLDRRETFPCLDGNGAGTLLDPETERGFDLAAQRDGERVATLRSKHGAAVTETQEAEKQLLDVKTAVEDAEAIYNNVRADIAAGTHGHGHHDDDPENDDWDKYLHFGDEHRHGDGDGEDGDARHAHDKDAKEISPEAAAAANAAAEMANDYQTGTHHVQSPMAAAAVRVTSGGGGGGGGGGDNANDHDDHDDGHEQHQRYGPSLQEAEQFLLSELKKLEAANARLMTARSVLAEIERQLNDAVERAEENSASAARRRAAAVSRNGLEEGNVHNVNRIGFDENGASDAHDTRREGSPAGPSGGGGSGDKNNTGTATAKDAQRRSAPNPSGGGGGKVIEDRRFGIYDSRRYRMEGEPAPPDPSDDEDGAGRSTSVRGRGASANAGSKNEFRKNGVEAGGKESAGNRKKGSGKEKPGVSADAVNRHGGGGGARGGRGGRGDGGRGASAGGGGRTGSTGRKITPASASQLRAAGRDEKHKQHQGFRFKKEPGDDGHHLGTTFHAPSAAEASTYVPRGNGSSLRWRVKRQRTLVPVGRPATGPTSWAAISSFALWRGGELEAAKQRSLESAGDADDVSDSSEEDDGFDAAAYAASRDDAGTPGFGLGDGWVEDDIVFDHFDHFDELAADDDGIVDIGAVMDLGFDDENGGGF